MPGAPDPARLSHSALRGRPFPRLYAILDVDAAEARGLSPAVLLDEWLSAGVRLVQLRAKALADGALVDLASRLSSVAAAAGALFVLNDRPDLAVVAQVDGVHVGQDDLPAPAARAIVGPAAVVGLSTHNLAQMREALVTPVDYLAIGPVFPTASKSRPDPVVGLEGVREAAATGAGAGRCRVVAIGGITLATAAGVIAAGADSIAVISDLTRADAAAQCRSFLESSGLTI